MISGQSISHSGDAPIIVSEVHKLSVLFSYWHTQHRDTILVDIRRPITLRPRP